jgi:hypothetical protein
LRERRIIFDPRAASHRARIFCYDGARGNAAAMTWQRGPARPAAAGEGLAVDEAQADEAQAR